MKITLLFFTFCFLPAITLNAQCKSKVKLSTAIDATGNAARKGKIVEGPACVEIYYNPLATDVTVGTLETRTAGPDPGSVFLGTSSSTAGSKKPGQIPAPGDELSTVFTSIHSSYVLDAPDTAKLATSLSEAIAAQDAAISGMKQLINGSLSVDPSTPDLSAMIDVSKSALLATFDTALRLQQDFQPADRGATSLLVDLRSLQLKLNGLPFQFSDGDKLAAGATFSCTTANAPKRIAWSDWYANAQCKGLYDSLTKNVQDAIVAAQPYAVGGDNVKSLLTKAANVNYWQARLDRLGIVKGNIPTDLRPKSVLRAELDCRTTFNNNTDSALSLVTTDERPTLDGSAPAAKSQDAFAHVTCGSPFSVSAGVGFSTTRHKEYAIVKSVGPTSAASVNKYGTVNDSLFYPLPMVLAHVRLLDSPGHLVGVHTTVGVQGNLQSQASGGSSVGFLLGGSVSLFRTLYLSAGLNIGTKAALTGGFNVGDLVPADITSIQGQVSNSYTTGFGFAISFTKP